MEGPGGAPGSPPNSGRGEHSFEARTMETAPIAVSVVVLASWLCARKLGRIAKATTGSREVTGTLGTAKNLR